MEKRPDKQAVDEAIRYACSKMGVEQLKPEQEKGVRAFLGESDVFI